MTINLDKLTALLGNPSDMYLASRFCPECRSNTIEADVNLYKHKLTVDHACSCGKTTLRWLASIPILEILQNLKILNSIQ